MITKENEPTPQDRLHFQKAVLVTGERIQKEIGATQFAANAKAFNPERFQTLIDQCERDRDLMRVLTFVIWSKDGYTTSECAYSLGLSDDVAETHLQAIARANLIAQ